MIVYTNVENHLFSSLLMRYNWINISKTLDGNLGKILTKYFKKLELNIKIFAKVSKQIYIKI